MTAPPAPDYLSPDLRRRVRAGWHRATARPRGDGARPLARPRRARPPICAPGCASSGIRFESVDGDDTWHVDPVPRVIPAGEWEGLAAGLGQRVRALNAFVADVYGARRIVAEGVMPARVLDTAEGFEPAMCGVAPARRRLDRGRRPRHRARRARALDGARGQRAHAQRHRLLDRRARGDPGAARPARGAAPDRGRGHWRCATCSARATRSSSPTARTTPPTGSTRSWPSGWTSRSRCPPTSRCATAACTSAATPVDAVYRRTNDDEVDSTVGALLHPVVAAGGVKLVNCLGTGVADDKLVHAYVHDMIRFYLDETPLLEQVETFDLGVPGDAGARARRLRRAGHQGPRLLRRHRRLHRAARRARGRRGAPRARSSPRPRTTSPSAWSASRPIRPRSTECLLPGMSTCDRSC